MGCINADLKSKKAEKKCAKILGSEIIDSLYFLKFTQSMYYRK